MTDITYLVKEALKSCPFCGGEAAIYSTTTSGVPRYPRAYCYCKDCRASGPMFTDTANDGQHIFNAIAAWNRRVTE